MKPKIMPKAGAAALMKRFGKLSTAAKKGTRLSDTRKGALAAAFGKE